MTIGSVKAGPRKLLTPVDAHDPRRERMKTVTVAASVIGELMSMKGQYSVRMEGWPEGAEIVGARLLAKPLRIVLYLYHPDFPVVITQPEQIKILARRVD